MEGIHLALVRRHYSHFIEFVGFAAGHQQHLVLAGNGATDHPEIHNHAPVGVVVGIENQGLEGLFDPIRRRRHPIDHGLEDPRHPDACFGGAGDCIAGIESDNRFDLGGDPFGVGAG